MEVFALFFLVVIAGICGAVGQRLAGNSNPGMASSLVIGFLGAIIGGGLQRALHLPEVLPLKVGDSTLPILWTVVGSFVLVFGLALFERRHID